MFDFFITMLNQTKRKKDDEMRGVVQEAMELWSEMVREELENDAECARRLRGLKRDCAGYLQEFDYLLSGPIEMLDPAARSQAEEALRLVQSEISDLQRSNLAKDANISDLTQKLLAGDQERRAAAEKQLVQAREQQCTLSGELVTARLETISAASSST